MKKEDEKKRKKKKRSRFSLVGSKAMMHTAMPKQTSYADTLQILKIYIGYCPTLVSNKHARYGPS